MFRRCQRGGRDACAPDGLLHAGLPRAPWPKPAKNLRDPDLRAERRGRTQQPLRASSARRTHLGRGDNSRVLRGAGDADGRGGAVLRRAAIG